MVLARELAVRLLDLLLGGGLGDAERLVVVLELHRSQSPAISPMRSISRASRRRDVRPRASLHQRPEPLHRLGNLQQPLHAGEVDAGLVDQVLDQPQPSSSSCE